MRLEKSLPGDFAGSLDEIAGQGWCVTRDIPLPNLILDRDVLRANIRLFQQYVDDRGALLAPHAKATMCPQVWEDQLDAGAWALTVATVSQLEVCVAFGVRRILIANEVVDRYAVRRLAELLTHTDDLEVICLVDSVAGVRRLAEAMAATGSTRRLDVMVEFGMPGGRAGTRSVERLVALAEDVIAHPDTLRLVGVEGYEGILGVSRDASALAAVDEYLESWASAIRAVLPLIEPGGPRLASSGGSIYFDRVVEAFAPLAGDCRLILRSGCYAAHDSGMFDAGSPFGAGAPGDHPLLEPALRVYAAVLSTPEPGLAIAGAGVRDVPVAEGLPIVLAVHQADGSVRPGGSLRPAKANDQHLYVEVMDGDPIAVGDVLELGVSHPCAVFDRWRTLLIAGSDGVVTGAATTYF